MPFKIGPVELLLILVIVTMLFGVGKLPEVFGSVGKGIREFRKAATDGESKQVPANAETDVVVDPTVDESTKPAV
jgi:sec-independent protein translocase protein TatA